MPPVIAGIDGFALSSRALACKRQYRGDKVKLPDRSYFGAIRQSRMCRGMTLYAQEND
jgi:hypothetical protein